jgi:NitT/TauT family transport system substrate-binding protein
MLGTGIFVTKDLAANKPALVKAFLAATAEGAEETIKDPDAAVAAIVKYRPEADREILTEGVKVLSKFIRTRNSEKLPLLAMAKEDWDETTKNLVTYLDMPSSFKSDAFYTNDLIAK